MKTNKSMKDDFFDDKNVENPENEPEDQDSISDPNSNIVQSVAGMEENLRQHDNEHRDKDFDDSDSTSSREKFENLKKKKKSTKKKTTKKAVDDLEMDSEAIFYGPELPPEMKESKPMEIIEISDDVQQHSDISHDRSENENGETESIINLIADPLEKEDEFLEAGDMPVHLITLKISFFGNRTNQRNNFVDNSKTIFMKAVQISPSEPLIQPLISKMLTKDIFVAEKDNQKKTNGKSVVILSDDSCSFPGVLRFAFNCQEQGAGIVLLPATNHTNVIMRMVVGVKNWVSGKEDDKDLKLLLSVSSSPRISKSHDNTITTEKDKNPIKMLLLPEMSELKPLLDVYEAISIEVEEYIDSARNGKLMEKKSLLKELQSMLNSNDEFILEIPQKIRSIAQTLHIFKCEFEESFCYLKDQATVDNFPVIMDGILSLFSKVVKDEKNDLSIRRRHCLDIIGKFIFAWSWSKEAIALTKQSSLIQENLGAILMGILHSPKDYLPITGYTDLFSIWAFAVECEILSKSNYLKEWKSLLVCISNSHSSLVKLRDALNHFLPRNLLSADFKKELKNILKNELRSVCDIKEVLRITLDHVDLHDIMDDFFRKTETKNMSPNDLQRFLADYDKLCWDDIPVEIYNYCTEKLPNLISHSVLNWKLEAIKSWLRNPISQQYSYPTIHEWKQFFASKQGKFELSQFNNVLDIIEQLESNFSNGLLENINAAEMITSVLSSFLRFGRILIFQTLLKAVKHRLLKRHWKEIWQLLSPMLDKAYKPINVMELFRSLIQFIPTINETDAEEMEIADTLFDQAILYFHPLVPNRNFELISSDEFFSGSTKTSLLFLNKFYHYCGRQKNITDYFESLDKIYDLVCDQKQSIFVEKLLTRVAYISRMDGELAVSVNFRALKEKYSLLTQDQRLYDLSLAEIDGLSFYSDRLGSLEKALQITNEQSQLTFHLNETKKEIQNLLLELHNKRPILESLRLYFPASIAEFEMNYCECHISSEELPTFSRAKLFSRVELVDEFVGEFTARNEIKEFLLRFAPAATENMNSSAGISGGAGKSILFHHYLSLKASVFDRRDLLPMEKIRLIFNEIVSVYELLCSVCSEKKTLKFEDIREISRILQDADRKTEKELSFLCAFFYSDQDSSRVASIEKNISDVITLCGLREILVEFFQGKGGKIVFDPTLQQLQFACADPELNKKDKNYHEILKLVHGIVNEKNLRTWDAMQCNQFLQKLYSLFGGKNLDNYQLMGILNLFNYAARCTKIWTFMKNSPDFISSQGVGYSDILNEKLEDFLSELSGEDAKIVYNFSTVAHWIAILISHQSSSFSTLINAVRTVPKIKVQLESQTDKRFAQLLTAEEHMDFIGELFAYGLSGLDSVLGQLKVIQEKAVYQFDANTNELSILYFDSKRGSSVTLNNEQLQDFQQRLGFVQREDKAAIYDIPGYLEKLESYRKKLLLLQTLHQKGHPRFINEKFALIVGRAANLSLGKEVKRITADTLNGLDKEMIQWEARVAGALQQHDVMNLFTMEQARKLSEFIISAASNELFLSLSHLLKGKDQQQIIEACLQEIDLKKQHDWLESFSAVLEALRKKSVLKAILTRNARHVTSVTGEEHGGCMRYISPGDPFSIQRLILRIFRDVPLPCQLLWCHRELTSPELMSFLHRCLIFPSMQFVLVQIDRLNLSQQQTILKFILENQTISNIHCIETGSSILQSATWLQVSKYDELCGDFEEEIILKRWMNRGKLHVDENNLFCFHGPSGSGKTYQMMNWVNGWEGDYEIISITEHFNWNELIHTIHQSLASNDLSFDLTLVFQINLGKFTEEESDQWKELLRNINILFFHLICLRGIALPQCDLVFNIPCGSKIRIAIELPDFAGHMEGSEANEPFSALVSRYLPVISACFQFTDASQCPLELSDEAIHVCKYLLAYENGTIDNLYQHQSSKDIIFVLDCSGSMAGSRIETCKNCLINDIFTSRISDDDRVGIVLFGVGNGVHQAMQLTEWRMGKQLADSIIRSASATGGTPMWTALSHGLSMFQPVSQDRTRIVVALTDGEATDAANRRYTDCLKTSFSDVQVLFITVGLDPYYEAPIRESCIRDNARDAIIAANGGANTIAAAWAEVGDRLTVSQQIEKEGENISLDECYRLLGQYMTIPESSRQKEIFWIRYMYRRCGILASSERFNKNNNVAKFGSTTMNIMLQEVARALSPDYQHDWNHVIHEQMVYRKQWIQNEKGEMVEDYTWSILCSNPNSKDKKWVARKALLKEIGLTVPTLEDLKRPDRRVLDSYLANGLGIPLHNLQEETSTSGEPFDFVLGSLPAIDENQFVLTLDFVIKMLTINERIECGTPCIMEGETGVSKTALTRMLFTLKNSSLATVEQSNLMSNLVPIIQSAPAMKEDELVLQALQGLAESYGFVLEDFHQDTRNDLHALAQEVCMNAQVDIWSEILDTLASDPSLNPLSDFTIDELKAIKENTVAPFLIWFIRQIIAKKKGKDYWAFYPVNVHASMTMSEITEIVKAVSIRAEQTRILGKFLNSSLHTNAKLCIFFDEINTASCMGILKEIIIDHTINGETIDPNVVIVAACNPARKKLKLYNNRREEHGVEWVSGHYQVHPLPLSLDQLKWDYGSLKASQEKEFISSCMEFLADNSDMISEENLTEFSEIIFVSQQITRELAKEHVRSSLDDNKCTAISEEELSSRASSSVSLRDILRAFKLFKYLLTAPFQITRLCHSASKQNQEPSAFELLLLTIGIVYYLRMGINPRNAKQDFRLKFRTMLKARCGVHCDVETMITTVMTNLLDQTILDTGIAKTRGLSENVFMIFFCLLVRIPLMVVGPPGSSKTLAVMIVMDNARGEYSKSDVYRAAPSMISFHYQCSRRSTSTQIQDVFERAIKRQFKAEGEGSSSLSFVFMDEAGLPEEGRESLKVLHYYLEDHVKVAAEVGFVAISNHVLDAAKSNRCAMLLRAAPDHEELLNITVGCLGTKEQLRHMSTNISLIDKDKRTKLLSLAPSHSNSQVTLLDSLCESFEACLNETPHLRSQLTAPIGFSEFFGLRDYMHTMKLLGRLAQANPTITLDLLTQAIDRNFNGSEKKIHQELLEFFLSPYDRSKVNSSGSANYSLLMKTMQNPIVLLQRSLQEQKASSVPIGRYLLIIDSSANDAILRFLHRNILSLSNNHDGKILKLSEFPDDGQTQQINLISQVRWSTEQGKFIVLSRTEAIHESLYDLFNQHFRKFEDRTGKEVTVVYHTNIAVGAHSRRCKVSPGFQCIVHLTLDELQVSPAPFLNRFEKYQITLEDALGYVLQTHAFLSKFVILRKVLGLVFRHVQSFVRIVGTNGFYGFMKSQTIESALLALVLPWTNLDAVTSAVVSALEVDFLRDTLTTDLKLSDSERLQLFSTQQQLSFLQTIFSSTATSRENAIAESVLAQSMLYHVILMLLQIAIPETFLAKASLLPRTILQFLLQSEKFSNNSPVGHPRKRLVITRTTASLIKLQSQLEHAHCRSFSHFNKEGQFEGFLKECLEMQQKVITIIFDLSQISVFQLNFARNKIDEIWPQYQPLGKSIVCLVHVRNSDLRIHHLYHSTFSDDWHSQFVDGIDDQPVDISWLQLGYQRDALLQHPDQATNLLSNAVKDWLPTVIQSVSSSINLFMDGKPISLKPLLTELLVLKDSKSSRLSDVILHRFITLWITEEKNYQLLQREIQTTVEEYAETARNVKLQDFVVQHLKSIFEKLLQSFVLLLVKDLNISKFLSIDYNFRELFSDLIMDWFKNCPLPPLAALQTPMRTFTVHHQQQDIGFPFFTSVHQQLEGVSSKVLLLFDDYDGEDIWQVMINRVHSILSEESSSLEAKMILRHCWDRNEEALSAYADTYLHKIFPTIDTLSLPFQFIKQWLITLMSQHVGGGQVAFLHLAVDWYKAALTAYISVIDPIAKFTTSLDDDDHLHTPLLKLIHRGTDISSEELEEAVITCTYETLIRANCLKQFDRFQGIYSSLTWQPSIVMQSASCQVKVDALKVIFVLSLAVPRVADRVHVCQIVSEEVNRTLAQDTEPKLLFSSLWKRLSSSKTYISALILLLQQWISSLPGSEVEWLYQNVLSNETSATTSLSIQQCAVILDILIFQRSPYNTLAQVSSGSSWMQEIQEMSGIDDLLQWRPMNAPYFPPWSRASSSHSFPKLADVFFHVVWKWVTNLYHSVSFVELLRVLEECEGCSIRTVQKIKKVVMVALRVFLLHKWADLVAQKNNNTGLSNAETLILVAQIESMNPINSWVAEFAGIIRRKSSSKFNKKGFQYWSNNFSNGNRILASWFGVLKPILENDSDLIAASFDLFPRDFEFIHNNDDDRTIKDVATEYYAEHCIVTGIDQDWLKQRSVFSFMWVLTYLKEFYEWLSDELFEYNSIPEAVVKSLSIGELLQRSLPRYDSKYLVMWTMIKLATENIPLAMNKLTDEMSIWDLISTTHPTDSHEGILLSLFRELAEIYSTIIRSCDEFDGQYDPAADEKEGIDGAMLALVTGINVKEIEKELEKDCSLSVAQTALTRVLHQAESFGVIQRLAWIDSIRSLSTSSQTNQKNNGPRKSLSPTQSSSSLQVSSRHQYLADYLVQYLKLPIEYVKKAIEDKKCRNVRSCIIAAGYYQRGQEPWPVDLDPVKADPESDESIKTMISEAVEVMGYPLDDVLNAISFEKCIEISDIVEYMQPRRKQKKRKHQGDQNNIPASSSSAIVGKASTKRKRKAMSTSTDDSETEEPEAPASSSQISPPRKARKIDREDRLNALGERIGPDSSILEQYLQYLRRVAPSISVDSLKPRYCNFTNREGGLGSISNSKFIQIYHSLDHDEMDTLLQSLNLIQQHTSASSISSTGGSVETIRHIVRSLYPREDEKQWSQRFGLHEKDQFSFLLSLSPDDIPKLIGYLHIQLQFESYIFANKPVELKKVIPETVHTEFDRLEEQILDVPQMVRDLEAVLIRHELIISTHPESPLIATLSQTFHSEESLLQQIPLLGLLQAAAKAQDFLLLCGHYVSLRLRMRGWSKMINSRQKSSLKKTWGWSIAHVNSSVNNNSRSNKTFRDEYLNYVLPWFLNADDEGQDKLHEKYDEKHVTHMAKKIQMWYRKCRQLRIQRQRDRDQQARVGSMSAGRGRGAAGRGINLMVGRGRGSDAGNKIVPGLMAEIARSFVDLGPKLKALEDLLANNNSSFVTRHSVDVLRQHVTDIQACSAPDKQIVLVNKAKQIIAAFDETTKEDLNNLRLVINKLPMEVQTVADLLRRCADRGIETAETIRARQSIDKIDSLSQRIEVAKTTHCHNLSLLKQLQEELKVLHLPIDQTLQQSIQELEKDSEVLRSGITRLGFSADCLESLTIDAFDLQNGPSDLKKGLKIDMSNKTKLSKTIDGLITKLEKDPWRSWIHSQAIMALAYSSPTHLSLYREDVVECLQSYFESLKTLGKQTKACGATLLVLSRLGGKDSKFQLACLRRCEPLTDLHAWMTETEFSLLHPVTSSSSSATSVVTESAKKASKDPVLSFSNPTERWKFLQQQENAIPSNAIDDLMKMVGLTAVKQKVLDVYESIWMESQLPQESRVPQSFHFALLGNPGTGKTTVGRLLSRMLHELSIRKTDNFIELTGEKLKRMGSNEAAQQLALAQDGTLFIDEAYALEPATNAEGAAVAMQLLDAAETERENITIIIAGYKNDMEKQLFDYNDGFSRRFPFMFSFEDYSNEELASVFESLCRQFHWKCESNDVLKLAARKVGRGRGQKGFGNAGAVRVLFETAYRRAMKRPGNLQTFIATDILGPPPLPENLPDLAHALDELDNITGMDAVKEKIHSIVQLAQANYQLELEGKEPRLITLNRVFLGNPGTGKTTVAKLYGRILKGLGLLSDGSWELKQPNDFIGQFSGESENKTVKIIGRCRGKVLIIDEAYGLYGSSFGERVINTLVGLVHNAPGEDIAVIMIGYDKEMRKMFREMNPGLSRRFSLEDPFVFEDYSDADLEKIALKNLQESGLSVSREVRRALIKSISVQRFAPNFGNAGTVMSLIAAAKQRITARDPAATVLTMTDLGIQQDKTDPFEFLAGLFKVDHIMKELQTLMAVIEQAKRDGRDPRQFLKNYIFLGNPGTGKTTVARMMANILYSMGLIGRNHVVIRSGLDLQGSYLGQTKDKVNEIMAEARGGILFIDEAYTLAAHKHSYCQEAVDQLVALMTSPEHLHNTVVILAGYPQAMQQMLQQGNEGLASRCSGRIEFPDWDANDCIAYIAQQCDKEGLTMDQRTIAALRTGLEEIRRLPGWANARDCVSVLKYLYEARANRGGEGGDVRAYLLEDVHGVVEIFRRSRLPVGPPPSTKGKKRKKEDAFDDDEEEGASAAFPLTAASRSFRPPSPSSTMEKEAQLNSDEEMEVEATNAVEHDGNDSPIFAALLEACKAAGYDDSHEKRKKLVTILENIERGGDFPRNLMAIVLKKTHPSSEQQVVRVLRPQVHVLLRSMRNAVQSEERRLQEIESLAKEEREGKEKEQAKKQEQLRLAGVCPMGFSWHRDGLGWRCAGEGHFISDHELDSL